MKPLVFRLPFGRSTLIPAGCIHYPIGERDLLKQWVKAVQDADNGFTILMGDAFDQARTHFRTHIRSYTADENSAEALDAHVRREVEALADILRPIRTKIIGAIQGNHYWTFVSGITSDQYLCQLLSIPYLGPMAAVRLEFMAGSLVRHQMMLVAHHHGGSAGGRTTSGDVNALVRMEQVWDADIHLLSHTHRRHAHKDCVLTLSRKGEPKLLERTKVFVRTGAFLKGFREDSPSSNAPYFPGYAEAKMLRPTDLGWVTVHIKLSNVHDKKNGGSEIRQNITVEY